jgi:hypothetical protein
MAANFCLPFAEIVKLGGNSFQVITKNPGPCPFSSGRPNTSGLVSDRLLECRPTVSFSFERFLMLREEHLLDRQLVSSLNPLLLNPVPARSPGNLLNNVYPARRASSREAIATTTRLY